MALISQEGSTKVYSNNEWIPFISGYELPESVKGDYDWLDDIDNSLFIKEELTDKNEPMIETFYYSLDEFMRYEGEFWDGIHGMGFFSAKHIKLSDCGDECMIGSILSVSSSDFVFKAA